MFKILFTICLITLLYHFLNIIKWEKDNRLNKELTDDLTELFENNAKPSENSSFIFVNSEYEDKNSSYWYYVNTEMINMDFTELHLKNNDTKGWIYVPGTDINYPFVQTTDNKYYLNHSFNKKNNNAGWIFLDYRNDINNLSKNNILYGHARVDKTMFGSLKNTLKKSWFENKENHVVKISTEKENTLWKVFSIYHIKTEPYYITTHFKNDDEFQQYIDKSLEKSIYKFDTNIHVNDTILTLSTCYGENEKLILQAKLIKKEIKNNQSS